MPTRSFTGNAGPMKGFVPKGNYSLRGGATSSAAAPSYNGAPAATGELDDTAQMGAEPTDSRDVTAGELSSNEQTSSGYGYDVAWMLPLRPAAFVGTGPTPAPAQPSVNQDVSADQVIKTPSPAGGAEAPTRFVFYYSGEAGESLVSNGAIQHAFFSSDVEVESGSITKVGSVTLTLGGSSTYIGGTTINAGTLTLGDAVTYVASIPTFDLSRNIGMIIGNGETKPAPSSFAGVVAFTGSSGTLLLDHSSDFSGTVAGCPARTPSIFRISTSPRRRREAIPAPTQAARSQSATARTPPISR
jgi:autotransporter-associated beta strand protein